MWKCVDRIRSEPFGNRYASPSGRHAGLGADGPAAEPADVGLLSSVAAEARRELRRARPCPCRSVWRPRLMPPGMPTWPLASSLFADVPDGSRKNSE